MAEAEERSRPLLLDTHIWIWALEGATSELSRRALKALERAAAAGRVRVAAISVWEVAMLEARGRLRLSLAIDEWVARALAAPGSRRVELTPEIAIDSARLPDDAPGDPVDRILVATARRTGAALMTRDRDILSYAAAGHLAAVDASP